MSDQGASANDWARVVSGIVGGKAGGKSSTFMGNGTEIDKLDEAIRMATEYLEKFTM